MKSVTLNAKKLFGFRLAAKEAEVNGVDPNAAAAKSGDHRGHKLGFKIGDKGGGKDGVKPTG